MQAIVKIIGRDCSKPHVWGGGLPGPPLFHIQFVFYSYILCTANTSGSLSGLAVFLAWSCPPGGAQVPTPAAQWPRRSKLETRSEAPDPFLPQSCHFLAASLLSAPGAVKLSLGGLALSRIQVPSSRGFLPFCSRLTEPCRMCLFLSLWK